MDVGLKYLLLAHLVREIKGLVYSQVEAQGPTGLTGHAEKFEGPRVCLQRRAPH